MIARKEVLKAKALPLPEVCAPVEPEEVAVPRIMRVPVYYTKKTKEKMSLANAKPRAL